VAIAIAGFTPNFPYIALTLFFNDRYWLKEIWMEEQLANVWGFELGNEVNNNWGKYNLSPNIQSSAFKTMSDILNRVWASGATPKIVGPDTGYYNASSWLPAVLEEIGSLPIDLHAVTHHVYPGITPSNFNDPTILDSFLEDDLKWYLPPINEYLPNAQIWAGENGPTGGGEDGTCGFPSACGTYMTVLWYADEMANRATHGFVQFQRQDFIGGAYSLLGIYHTDEALLDVRRRASES